MVESAARSTGAPAASWSSHGGAPTTFVLLRHGVTEASVRRLFSGSGGVDHELTDLGHQQADAAAQWIVERFNPDAILASPLRRARQTAESVARHTGLDIALEHGFAEVDFGEWDGYTFEEIGQRWQPELDSWLGSLEIAPPGGESFAEANRRVLAARDKILVEHAGRTLVVVSHVTPIKLVVGDILGTTREALFRLELSPASITQAVFWPDGNASVRGFNIVP